MSIAAAAAAAAAVARPALRAVGRRSGSGGPGVRAALVGAAPAISGLVGGERPRLPRLLAGPTTTPQSPAVQAPTVTTTESSNDEPATVGSANGSAMEFQSATSPQRASEQPRPTPVV